MPTSTEECATSTTTEAQLIGRYRWKQVLANAGLTDSVFALHLNVGCGVDTVSIDKLGTGLIPATLMVCPPTFLLDIGDCTDTHCIYCKTVHPTIVFQHLIAHTIAHTNPYPARFRHEQQCDGVFFRLDA
jgi:hypothetical protein